MLRSSKHSGQASARVLRQVQEDRPATPKCHSSSHFACIISAGLSSAIYWKGIARDPLFFKLAVTG
jgi:hypothetical protein